VSVGVVRLAGLAGAVAGGISMAAGEWVSVSSQNDLIERELDVERRELRLNPEQETDELAAMYEQHGMGPERARSAAAEVMQQPDVALAVHAREEFGIDPDELPSAVGAAGVSLVCFLIGAFLPLIPWFIGGGAAAAWASLGIGLLCCLILALLWLGMSLRAPGERACFAGLAVVTLILASRLPASRWRAGVLT